MGWFSRNKQPLGDYEWNIDENGALTITGCGFTSDKSPWCDRSKEVRKLIVKGTGDVILGKNSFCFGFDNLEEVYLDKNVKRIEESAFMRVSTLRKVDIEGDCLEPGAVCVLQGSGTGVHKAWKQHSNDRRVLFHHERNQGSGLGQ